MALEDEKLDFTNLKTIMRCHVNFKIIGEHKQLIFKIYPKEHGHNEPHCHIQYDNDNISVSLISLSIICGTLPAKKQTEAIEWIKNNLDIIKKLWNEYHELSA